MASSDPSALSLISTQTQRNLSDKLYERRKQGASEIETLVKQLRASRDERSLRSVIHTLSSQFVFSVQANSRKGGLIGLAATAVGLLQDIDPYLEGIVPPVLKCLSDQDAKVRFHACESLYNIAKVARGAVLKYFNEIFDGLCKLCADPDPQVKNGAELLDRLVKDVVAESDGFPVRSFIPLIHDRISTNNPYVRQFLVAWIELLDTVPDITLLDYLPQFLDGLFSMLSDPNQEICRQAHGVLSEFLRALQSAMSVEFSPLVHTVLHHCSSSDDYTRNTALTWLLELLLKGQDNLLSSFPSIVAAVLPCLSHKEESIRVAAAKVNDEVKRLASAIAGIVGAGAGGLDHSSLLAAVRVELQRTFVPTRLASLQWLSMLHSRAPSAVLKHLDDLLPVLLRILSDPAEEVVALDLQVLAQLVSYSADVTVPSAVASASSSPSSSSDDNFARLMRSLVRVFAADSRMLGRAGLVIRQLSMTLDPFRIFTCLASILEEASSSSSSTPASSASSASSSSFAPIDPQFAATMAQSLNIILLTSPELFSLRQMIRNSKPEGSSSSSSAEGGASAAAAPSEEGQKLFMALYPAWCHSPVSLVALCLFAQAYNHASALVCSFADMEINVNILVQIDKLVQLIESPIFAHTRLQLLEPQRHPALLKALYGLLMLLPQSSAYDTLKNRLKSVSNMALLQVIGQGPSAAAGVDGDKKVSLKSEPSVDFAALMTTFRAVQDQHSRLPAPSSSQ